MKRFDIRVLSRRLIYFRISGFRHARLCSRLLFTFDSRMGSAVESSWNNRKKEVVSKIKNTYLKATIYCGN